MDGFPRGVNHKIQYFSFDDFESIIARTADNSADPQKKYEEHENKASLHRALQGLTDIQREVITLKFMNELTNKEVAELLGKTEESVRQLQCRAIRSLKSILENQNHYE